MPAKIIQGNVFDVLPTIEPGSIDAVCTSPPYFQLRSYLPKNHPLKHLELGSEKSPAEFIANLVRVFDLVRECMADHACAFINIGDTICSLDLCLIPQRLAISLQDAGWIVRSVIVWEKPSAMPQSLSGWSWRRCRVKERSQANPAKAGLYAAGSGNHMARPGSGGVTGKMPIEFQTQWSDCPGCKNCRDSNGYVLRRGSWRPTSSYEPILMLAKSKNYFADGEPVKTPAAAATISRDLYSRVLDDPDEQFAVQHDHETVCDSGANLRDVWRIAAEPLKESHYASFPTELCRRILQCSTSARGYCPTCGKPWVRVIERVFHDYHDNEKIKTAHATGETPHRVYSLNGKDYQHAFGDTIGWRQSCSCAPAEPRPAKVLDPFAGSGRTGIAAIRLGLDFTGIELNPSYVEMSERILRDESPLFALEQPA